MREKIWTKQTKADLVQRLLTLNGYPYSLQEYPMFCDVYNSRMSRIVMRAGRQVSKTTMEAGDMVMSAVLTPYTSIIYCNSSFNQTRSFSSSKLKPFITQSPLIYDNYLRGKDVTDAVDRKKFSNFSEIFLSYFSESADRVRGTSGSRLYLDEVQDMLFDAMIDAEECLSAAPNPVVFYAGTSKTSITPLEFWWQESSQKEWLIRCPGCKKYNRPSTANIGLKGLICKTCGHALNTYEGFWHPMHSEDKTPRADGYWIPQIIMPMHCCHPDKWRRLLEKQETYPNVKFDNEVMGLPSGEGESPITEEMLRGICLNVPMMDRVCPENATGHRYITAGIDWGGGGIDGTSRTVLSIYAVYPDQPRYVKIFGKIYSEGEPSRHVDDIGMWLVRFGVHMCCGDHGGGNFAMSQLKERIPLTMRLVPVMYSGGSSAPYSWSDKEHRYTVDRTVIIDEFFADMQRQRIFAFRWEDFEPFARDILNVKQLVIGEERGIGRRVWRHRPKDPDDSLHSMVFGWFAARVLSGRMDFTVMQG